MHEAVGVEHQRHFDVSPHDPQMRHEHGMVEGQGSDARERGALLLEFCALARRGCLPSHPNAAGGDAAIGTVFLGFAAKLVTSPLH